MPGIHFYMEHFSKHGFVTCARVYIIILFADAIHMSVMWRYFTWKNVQLQKIVVHFNEEMVHFAWRKIVSNIFSVGLISNNFGLLLFHHVLSLFSHWIFLRREFYAILVKTLIRFSFQPRPGSIFKIFQEKDLLCLIHILFSCILMLTAAT